MSEFNLFCYSKNYNDKNSFQQERHRAFNKSIGQDRYYELLKEVRSIIPNKSNLKLPEFWKSITQGQWANLLAIKEAKDFKEGFEYISGQKITNSCDGKEVEIDGKTYILKEKK